MTEPSVARHIALGEHYLSVKMPEKSIEQLHAALAIQPENERARLLLVRCLRQVGRQQEAHLEVATVLQANPHSVDAHYMASFLASKTEDALSAIERALELCPYDSALHAQRAAILLRSSTSFSRIFKKREIVRQSEQAARHALKINPQNWQAHRLLAVALLSQNRTPEARMHVMATLSLNPDNPRSHLLLSLLSNHQNDARGAEAAMREALRLDPTNRRLQRDLEIQQITGPFLMSPFADNPDDLVTRGYMATLGRLPALWQLPTVVGALCLTMAGVITIPSQWMQPGDLQSLVIIGFLFLFCFLFFNLNIAARPWLARVPIKYLPADWKKWGKGASPSDSL